MYKDNKKQGGKSRYKPSFGAKKSYGGGSGGWQKAGDRNEVHEATCAECNQSCTVPFKPNGRKPVLCSGCFRETPKQAGAKRFDDRPSFNRSSDRSSDRPSFNRSSDRPSFNRSSDRPSFNRPAPAAGPDLKREMVQLNQKFDQMLVLLKDIAKNTARTPVIHEIPVASKESTADEFIPTDTVSTPVVSTDTVSFS